MNSTRSIRFNGTNQYLTISDAAQSGLEATSFTVMGWVKVDAGTADGADRALFNKYASGAGWAITLGNGGYIFADIGNGQCGNQSTSYADAVPLAYQIDDGRWHHVAVTYDNSTIRIYIDGLLSAYRSVGAKTLGSSAAMYVATGENGSFNRYGAEFMQHLRYYNTALSASAIVTEAYSQVNTHANLVSWWKFDGDLTDSKGSNTLTAGNSPVYSSDIPWEAPTGVQSSGYVLDLEKSSSQYAAAADNAALDITSDLTFEAWITPESLPSSGSNHAIAAKWTGTQLSYIFALRNESGTLGFRMYNTSNGSNVGSATVNYTPVAGERIHVAFVYTASSGTLELYVNGVRIGSATGLQTSIFNGTAAFEIGRNDGSEHWDGLISEVRLFNDKRTQAEIVADAINHGSVSDANLKGQWLLNNSYADSSGNSNTLTPSGSPTFKKFANLVGAGLGLYFQMEGNSTDEVGAYNGTDTSISYSSGNGKKGQGAGLASGSSSKINLPTVAGFANAMTVSMWIKTTQSTLSYPWVGENSGNTANFDISINNSGGANKAGTGFWNGSTYTLLLGTKTINDGNFHHVVAVRNGSTVYLYIDGALEAVSTSFSSNNVGLDRWAFGYDRNGATGYYNGAIDEPAIYYRALTYGEILDLYNLGNAIAYSGAVDVSVSAGCPTAAFTQPVATVTATRAVSVAGTLQSAAFSVGAVNVTATRAVTVSPTVPSASFTIPASTVTTTRAVTVNPTVPTAAFVVRTPNIITPDAQVSPNMVSATFTIPSYTPIPVRNVSVSAGCPTAQFALQSPSVRVAVTISPSVLSASFTANQPGITAIRNASVAPSALTATFSLPARTVSSEQNALVNPSAPSATFSTFAPSVSVVSNITISPAVQVAVFSIPAVQHSGGIWSIAPKDPDEWSVVPRTE